MLTNSALLFSSTFCLVALLLALENERFRLKLIKYFVLSQTSLFIITMFFMGRS